ncbi:LysE family translocator [Sulfurospirillum sp. 1612]|uniref:LysE family translocator n=1 Tax=Sulfurospirillum sp. 1612 TaxID=3094835 RepID=UPI002F93490F
MSAIISLSVLTVFIPTFFLVSLTPGMCMTLAMSLGMSIGLKRTLAMMAGELVGVAIVALSSVIGASAIMLRYPEVFVMLKTIGGLYLIYIGIMMLKSKGKLALSECGASQFSHLSNKNLAFQGFITAIANPKGWAFFISLLPPFINNNHPILPQIMILLSIILCLEFTCLMIYASGGSGLKKFLQKKDNVKGMNKIAGCLMCGVGIWLIFD